MQHAGGLLAAGLLASLTAMGSSRKVFGPDVVAKWLVPHRTDIGIATFFSIGFALACEVGLMDSGVWAPGGSQHLMQSAVVQLGYLQSLLARRDFGARALVLVLVWVLLAVFASSPLPTVAVEVFSLWVVKLRLPSAEELAPAKKGKARAGGKPGGAPTAGAQERRTQSPSAQARKPPRSSKSKAKGAARKR